MSGIDKIDLSGGRLLTSGAPAVPVGAGRNLDAVLRKHFGDPTPRIVDISRDAVLQAIFSQKGALERIKRRLEALSRKKGRIIPAQGTIASAESEEGSESGIVYVGVEFAAAYQDQEPVLAGVLAHEWNHLLSEFPNGLSPDDLTWEEIFELRKTEEAEADAYAGRMLHRLGYTPEGLISFLKSHPTKLEGGSPKYYPLATREAVIRRAFAAERSREDQTRRLQLIARPVYRNPYLVKLLSIA